jgi:hypothetical protein
MPIMLLLYDIDRTTFDSDTFEEFVEAKLTTQNDNITDMITSTLIVFFMLNPP